MKEASPCFSELASCESLLFFQLNTRWHEKNDADCGDSGGEIGGPSGLCVPALVHAGHKCDRVDIGEPCAGNDGAGSGVSVRRYFGLQHRVRQPLPRLHNVCCGDRLSANDCALVIRTMLDIPCGDTNWQFESWEMDSIGSSGLMLRTCRICFP